MGGNAATTADPRATVRDLTLLPEDRVIAVTWNDGHISRYPFIWLRHAMFFPTIGRPDQAPRDPPRLPDDPHGPAIASAEVEAGDLVIRWSGDGVITRHCLKSLRADCLSERARRKRRPSPLTWMAGDAVDFPGFDVSDLNDPAGRLALFEQVRDRGIAFLRGLPPVPGTLLDIARHFGPVRRTHFGSLFDIRSLPRDRRETGANIGATAFNELAPHNDEGWRHGPPGIVLFHCLKPDPTGGGASIFVDGIGAAQALLEQDPEAFELLTRTPMLFRAERNPKERFKARGPMIVLDMDGTVRGIRVTDRTLAPLDLPEALIEPAYRAVAVFYGLLYEPERALEVPLKSGDMVVFDNHRILHARRAFDPEAGERHIQQLSVDREEWHNLFRQLGDRLGRDDIANWEPDAGVLSRR